MDNLTHSLVGAMLGQAGLKRKTGLAMPALILGANLPDVDAACFFWLEGVQHLGFRRGITHGPVAWLLLPLVLAGALWWFDRWQARRGKRPAGRLPVRFGWLYALAFAACLTHPALDWLNVYGIRFLEPFSSRWFYGDVLFIVDVWLWLWLGFATWFSLRRERRGGEWRRPAWIAIAVALGYVSLNGWITASAERHWRDSGEKGVIASPVPLAFWQREIILFSSRNPATSDPQIFDHTVWAPEGPPGRSLANAICTIPPGAMATPDVRAFLFWSRVPFIERTSEGELLLRDARFAGPATSGRFTVRLGGGSACIESCRDGSGHCG